MAACNNADDYDGSCEGDEDSRSQPASPLDSSSKPSLAQKLKAGLGSGKEPPDRKEKGTAQKVDKDGDNATPVSNHCQSRDGTDSDAEEDEASNQEGSLSNASSTGKKDSNTTEPAELNGSVCTSDESASNSKPGSSSSKKKVGEQSESSAEDELLGEQELAEDQDGSLQDGELDDEKDDDEDDDLMDDKLLDQDDSLQDEEDALGGKSSREGRSLDNTDVDEDKLLAEDSDNTKPLKEPKKELDCKADDKEKPSEKRKTDKTENEKMEVKVKVEKEDDDTTTEKSKTGEKVRERRSSSKDQKKDKDDSVSAADKEAMKEAMKMEVRRSARQRIIRDRQSEERARKESEASETEEVVEQPKVKRDYSKSPHRVAGHPKGPPEKPHTIIVTETKSLAQVINNAVRKEMGGPQEGKPTLVIIETKSSPGEVSISTISKAVTSISNTITVSTGMSSRMPTTTLTPISMSNMTTLTPTSQISKYVSASSTNTTNTVALTPSIIEDGGMAVEVPSLVVPYLIEYPPSRTISEFLKMLPLDAKEIKELEEAKAASKKKALEAAAAAAAAAAATAAATPSTSQGSPSFPNPIGRPKAADRWGAYFDSNLGKFFVDIGLNLTREWVQNDLVKSQKRKAEKEGRNVAEDKTLEALVNSLAETKEKNEPFHHPMRKCSYCSFKTESMTVMKHHYSFPHQRHVVHRSMQVEYRCNFCTHHTNVMQDIKFHMEAEHNVVARLERPYCFHHCPLCEFEDNSKAKVTKHIFKCQKKFYPERNLAPPPEFDPPAKRPKVYPIIPPGMNYMSSGNKYNSSTLASQLAANRSKITTIKPKDYRLPIAPSQPATTTYRTLPTVSNSVTVSSTTTGNLFYRSSSVMYPQPSVQRTTVGHTVGQPPVFVPSNQGVMVNQMMTPSTQQYQTTSQIYQVVNSSGQLMPVVGGNFGQLNTQRFTVLPTATSNSTSLQGPTPVALVPNIAGAPPSRSVLLNSAPQRMQTPKPNISITPVTTKASVVPVRTRLPTPSTSVAKLGLQTASSFVVCEICDGYIKDLEQLRTHMQWIHKVKIHPKMIFNRPPLNCQKCQFRFFTDQGLERHLLGAHGLVTSSMQENANKGQDSGRCTICGKVFQWKLLAHMSKDHNMILKPAHLSYKCTVCAATFGMYKLFETHVYQAHSTVAKRVLDTPDDKKTKPAAPEPAKPPEVKPVAVVPSSAPMALECSMCGMPFARIGNYYRHWERMHLKPCKVKLCRIDQCAKCLSKFEGKTPWTVLSDDDEAEEEEGGLGGDSDVEEKSAPVAEKKEVRRAVAIRSSGPPQRNRSSVKTVVATEPEEESMFDMDVETHDDTDDESAMVEDDEDDTALDMEVESHDVEHPSPGSIHTDEDD